MTNLSIMSLQFRGHEIFFQLQLSSLWASMSFCLSLIPQTQCTSFMTHRSEWNEVSPLLTFSAQWLQTIFHVDSTLHAKIFLQNWPTLCRHIGQEIGPPVLPSSSTQKPQNEWPHGVAICANTTGLVLQKNQRNWIFFVNLWKRV